MVQRGVIGVAIIGNREIIYVADARKYTLTFQLISLRLRNEIRLKKEKNSKK